MSYIIGMVSQKGGAGKSTLARLFARELAKDGFSVKIADLDTQQTTCTEWAADRAESNIEPEIQVQPFGNIKTALAEAGRFDAYILDGRPHSSQQTLEIARTADLTVIPTGQTKDDPDQFDAGIRFNSDPGGASVSLWHCVFTGKAR